MARLRGYNIPYSLVPRSSMGTRIFCCRLGRSLLHRRLNIAFSNTKALNRGLLRLLTKWYFCLNRTPSFPHDFSGNPAYHSNSLFLLKSLDTRVRGYDGIFLRFCAEIPSQRFVSNLESPQSRAFVHYISNTVFMSASHDTA